MTYRYFTSTRTLLVASLHAHLNPLQSAGLRLLIKTLPHDPFAAAHDFCAITGLSRPVKRALIKHNVSVPYEAHQLLQEREQAEFIKHNGVIAPGETRHGSN